MRKPNNDILLLEDDAVQVLLFVSSSMPTWGDVVTFSEVDDALRTARKRKSGLFVVDLGVYARVGNYAADAGVRFIAEVRQEQSKTVPIVVATSSRDPGDILPSFLAGADDYVLKDEGMPQLITRLDSWIKHIPYTEVQLEKKRQGVIKLLERMTANDIQLI